MRTHSRILLVLGIFWAVEVKGLVKGTVLVDSFGAVGNGLIDDTEAIQNALASGSRVIFRSGVIYKTSKTIVIGGLDIDIDADGFESFTIAPTASFKAFQFSGRPVHLKKEVACNIVRGQRYIVLDDVRGIQAGMLIKLKSNLLWAYDNRNSLRKGELHLIEEIVERRVYLQNNVFDSYCIKDEKLQVEFYIPISCRISKMEIAGQGGVNSSGMTLAYVHKSFIRNVVVRDARVAGIGINNSYETAIDSCWIIGSNMAGLGYGIQANSSTKLSIENCYFEGCRRGVDFSGDCPSRLGTVRNSRVNGKGKAIGGSENFTQSSGFGTHGTAEHILFENNQISNCRIGIYSRGRNIVVRGNTFLPLSRWCVFLADGDSVLIQGNKALPYKGKEIRSFCGFSSKFDSQRSVILTGNYFRSISGEFIEKRGRSTTKTISEFENVIVR